MEIRKAVACDLPRINTLLYQVAKVHADGRTDLFKSATKKYTDKELLEIINGDSTPVFVALINGVVVGYAFCVFQKTENSLLLQDRKTLYIDDICVDEAERGKGIGRAIYRYLTDFALKNGFDDITLNVWAFNDGAYRFYKSLGMTERKIVMEKNLK